MQLSPNFALAEFLTSQTAIRRGSPLAVDPGTLVAANLQRLCYMVLEPWRELIDSPLIVTSGYRPPWLNRLIGGSEHSEHMDGRAFDGYALNMPLREAFEAIRDSDIPYNQLIFEFDSWIHVSVAPALVEPRRQVLEASGSPSNPVFKAA